MDGNEENRGLLGLIPKSRWQDAAGLVISSAFLWWTLSNTSDGIWDLRLSAGRLGYFSLSVLSFLAVCAIQGWRMRWYLAKQPFALRGISGFSSVCIGNFYSAVLPGNLGEVVKMHHFARRNHVPFRRALACWVGEKFADGLAMASISPFLLLIPGVRHSWLAYLVLLPMVGAAASVAVVVLSVRRPYLFHKSFKLIPGAGPARFLFRVFTDFKGTLLSRSGAFRFRAFILIAYAMAGLNAAGFACNLWAAGVPDGMVTVGNMLTLTILMALIYFVPSAPSSVGVVHFGVYSALGVMAVSSGLTSDPALTDALVLASVVFHLSYFLPEIAIGAWYVLKERKLLFRLTKADASSSYM